MTGYSGCLTYEDYATIAYDAASGDELWVRRYDGPGNAVDYAWEVAVSPDGTKTFVTGFSDAINFIRDYATVAYDTASGEELWVRRYDGPGDDEENDRDEAYGVAVSPDGTMVFVSGFSDGGASNFDYATLAYDAATGEELWLNRYDGPASVEDIVNAMAPSPDGTKVFVTGHSYALNSSSEYHSDYATVAYEAATGREMWLARHDGPAGGFDVANAVAVSPDGARVFVTGFTDTVSISTPSYTTVAYDAESGETLWSRDYDGPSSGNDSAHAVGVSKDGTMVFVTGISSGLDST